MQKSLTGVCILLNFLLLFVLFFHPIDAINVDLGRHILLGKIIVKTHTVPKINLLSYTYPTYPFINSTWLSAVFFYLLSTFIGFPGLLIVTTSIVFLTFLIIFILSLKQASLMVATIAASLYINMLGGRTEIRPEIFSFFFFALFLLILYRNQQKYTRLIFFLTPLEIIWVNTQIYFFIGIILLMFFFMDNLITNNLRLTRANKILAIVWFFSVLATCVNPSGIRGALFPMTVLYNYGFPVLENQSIVSVNKIFFDPTNVYFAIVAIVLFTALLLTWRQTKPLDWLLAIFFSFAGFIIVRNMPLFIYGTFLPFTRSVSLLLIVVSRFLKQYLKKTHFSILKIYILFLTCILLLFTLTKVIFFQQPGFGIADKGARAVDFFLARHLTGPLYNNYNIGGYLTYRLYPKEKVFLDGRPEAYPPAFFQQVYLPLQQNYDLFKKMQKKYHFKTIILSHWDQTPWKDPFFINILRDPQYTLIYLDNYALILVSGTTVNKRIIQTYQVNKNTFTIEKDADERALIQYIFFFEKVGWTKQENAAYERLLALAPHACLLRNTLALLSTDQTGIKNMRALPAGQCF